MRGSGQCKNVLELLDEIQQNKLECGVISCNAAISLCEKDEQLEKALQLLDAIQQRKLGPNMINFNMVIGACKKKWRWKQALELLGEMHQCRLESESLVSMWLQRCEKDKL